MRISVFKCTQDDWYPSYSIENFSEKLVEVSLEDIDGAWYVQAWGKDDCGFEMRLSNRYDATKIFNQVISLEYVNMKNLTDLGFNGA